MPIVQHSFWYRASEDPETSLRPSPQMISGGDVSETLRSLLAQGYRVQQVRTETLCGTCQGLGTEHYRPKGWGRRSIPRSYLPTRPCRECAGQPVLDSETHTMVKTHDGLSHA